MKKEKNSNKNDTPDMIDMQRLNALLDPYLAELKTAFLGVAGAINTANKAGTLHPFVSEGLKKRQDTPLRQLHLDSLLRGAQVSAIEILRGVKTAERVKANRGKSPKTLEEREI